MTLSTHDDPAERMQRLLDAVPPPLEPLDLSALDGYLCGVLLQPRAVPTATWWPWVIDVEGRGAPAGATLEGLQAAVLERHAELDRAIRARRWFDPWIAELDADEPIRTAVLPWVAGFAAAMEHFPGLVECDDARLIEPLAMLYLHFDPADLEDADALLEVIESLEPPTDLAEAAEDLVRAVLLMADVTRPLAASPRPARAAAPRRRPARR
jgi:uncharacterized protein